MKKEVALEISHNLNTPKIMDALYAYADERIEELRRILELSKDPYEMREIQGAIQEARRLKRIRDNALAVVNLEMKR